MSGGSSSAILASPAVVRAFRSATGRPANDESGDCHTTGASTGTPGTPHGVAAPHVAPRPVASDEPCPICYDPIEEEAADDVLASVLGGGVACGTATSGDGRRLPTARWDAGACCCTCVACSAGLTRAGHMPGASAQSAAPRGKLCPTTPTERQRQRQMWRASCWMMICRRAQQMQLTTACSTLARCSQAHVVFETSRHARMARGPPASSRATTAGRAGRWRCRSRHQRQRRRQHGTALTNARNRRSTL